MTYFDNITGPCAYMSEAYAQCVSFWNEKYIPVPGTSNPKMKLNNLKMDMNILEKGTISLEVGMISL